jgi:hypothetical protein
MTLIVYGTNKKALMKNIVRKIQVVFQSKPTRFVVPVKVLVPMPFPRWKTTLPRR